MYICMYVLHTYIHILYMQKVTRIYFISFQRKSFSDLISRFGENPLLTNQGNGNMYIL